MMNEYILYFIALAVLLAFHMTYTIYPDFSCIKYNNYAIININKDSTKISEDMVYIRNVFNLKTFQNMNNTTDEIVSIHDSKDDRNFFRKNITIPASSLINTKINDVYKNKEFIKLLRDSINKKITPVDCNDKSSMNLLIYNKPGDYIYWHNDPNHYTGRRYTVLVMIKNTSDVQLVYKMDDKEYDLHMDENSILIFDGSKITHKTTKLKENHIRNLLSFTYCETCNTNNYLLLVSKVKDFLLGY